MICSLFFLIAQLLLHIMLTNKVNLGLSPYFKNIRVGKVVFLTSKLQIDQLNVISTSYNTPLPKNAQLVCLVALNSFSIPVGQSIINRVKVASENACTQSYITLTIFSNNLNHNIVSYFVLNEKVIEYSNFVSFQAQFFLKDYSRNMSLKNEHPLKNFNTSKQVKAFGFFSGFQLKSSLRESKTLVTSNYGVSIKILNLNSSVLVYTVNQKWEQNYRGHISIVFIVYNQYILNPTTTTRVKVNTLRLTNFQNIIINDPDLQNQDNFTLFLGLSEISANNHFTFHFELITHGRIRISSSSQHNTLQLTYLIFPRQQSTIEQQNKIQLNILSDTVVQSSSSTMTFIMIVVGATSAALAIIIICCFCCKKQQLQLPKQHQQQQQQGQKREEKPPSLIKLRRSQLLIDQLKEQICTICLLKKIHLMTHCQHFFHLQCLKISLSHGQRCPECRKELFGRKITIFCRNCSVGYVFAFEQLVGLDEKLGVDSLCQKCRNETSPDSQKEIKSDKSEHVWLQYAIQNNQNLFLD